MSGKVGIKTQIFWERVYDILIDTCGAYPNDKERFVELKGDFTEWRFQGFLGFGGKIWNNTGLRVSYYPEDQTPERDKMVHAANLKLGLLVDGFSGYELDA